MTGQNSTFKKRFILAFISFISLSLAVNTGYFKTPDWQSLIFFQSLTPKSLDPFLSLFSLIGSFWIITGITSFILLILKNYRLLFYFLLTTFFLHLVEIFGKNFIAQPLPPKELVRTVLPFHIPFSSIKTSYAFPSGHSMRTVFSTLIGFYLIKISKLPKITKVSLKTLLFIFAFIMLYSRISLGEHWFSDVLGGVLLGYIGWHLVKYLSVYKTRHKKF